ncbi:MAG TPA: efflux RND transporter permease subunit [Thermohalobaculum sp.]|nr:efflux RND transporter permease subunit [Thermohalobaculum sp.]
MIQLDFAEWDERRPAAQILAEARARIARIPGIEIQTREQESGPPTGKPVQLEITGGSLRVLEAVADRIEAVMERLGGYVDVEDTRSLPGVEWRLMVDRERAARYGADVALLGQAVKMTTAGLTIAEYRPDYADDEVEIRVRFPAAERTLERLEQLRVPTELGLIPISNFVELQPAPKTGTIQRIDGSRVITVSADVAEGLLPADKIAELQEALATVELPDGVSVAFAGQDEDQREAMQFLTAAFGVALFLMLLVLVTQFNSIYQALLVLSAIVFSTAGVFLGLLVTGRPFGIVMGGIGVIALSGIVVNNNIVLIDTFNELRPRAANAVEAAMRAGAQRLRPVLLTTVTTVLGLLPMMLAMNVDLIGRDIAFGAPSTQFWTDLSTAIGGGLSFATLLTLVLTPCMLVLGAHYSERLASRRRGRGALELTSDLRVPAE